MNPDIDFLIIDDEVFFGDTLKRSLETRSYSALHARDLKYATELLKTHHFNQIILDQKLDYENGLELLLNTELVKDSKVVILTGYASISSTTFALKNGAFNLVQKPASLDEILKAFDDIESISPLPLEVPSLEDVEREHIERVLKEHGGNVSRSAKALGMHRRSLQRKLLSNQPDLNKS